LKLIDKTSLHQYCINLLEDKINAIKKEIANAKESANADTKSSMGDKYETSRAMLQIQQENLTKQLAETNSLLNQLEKLDINAQSNSAINGSLVFTENVVLFLAAALGKINFMKKDIMVISPQSPIGKILLGAKVGDSIQFNKTTYKINNIV
jgi:transcription elongation GreA/GreB family factor